MAGIPDAAARSTIDLSRFESRSIGLPDLLERLSGVDVVTYGGTGQGSFVRIRGSSSEQVLVVVDGVRMNPVAGGGADFDSIPRELVDRVEVARGAGSARYGADALGGVVSLVSDPAARRGGVTGAASSGGALRTSATAAGLLRGAAPGSATRPSGSGAPWRYDLTVRREISPERFEYYDSLRDESRTRTNADADAWGAAGGLRGPLGGGDLSLRLWGTALAAGSPGPSEFPTGVARRGEDRGTVAVRWEERDGGLSRTAWTVDGSFRNELVRYRNDEPILGASPVRVETRGSSAGGGAIARRAVGAWLLLGGGADARVETIDDRDAGRHGRTVAGTHGEATALLGKVEATVATRLEGVDDRSSDGGPRLTALPSAGVVLRLRERLSVRAHGGRAYRLPTFLELWLPNMETVGGNPDLEPEDAWSGDVGIAASAGDLGRLEAGIDAAVFGTSYRQSILFAPVSETRFGPVNAERAWIAGTELSATTRFAPRGDGRVVEAELSWTRLESKRIETDAPLPGRPRDRWFARLAGRPVPWVEPFVEATWNSGGYADFFGNLEIPAGEVIGAGLSLRGSGRLEGLSLTVEGSNLTDADVRDARYFPQPGRTVWVTTTWRAGRTTASQGD